MNVIIKIDNQEKAIIGALEDHEGLVNQYSDAGRYIGMRTSFENAIEVAIDRQLNMQALLDLQPEYVLSVDQKLRWHNTVYLSFRKQDLVTPFPNELPLLRAKYSIVGNPTMQEVFDLVEPNVMEYIKLYNTTEYVILPLALSAKRVVLQDSNNADYVTSEIDELNVLASQTAQSQSGGVYITFPPPGSTVFTTYQELVDFNWDN
jgi:hypothetical protein